MIITKSTARQIEAHEQKALVARLENLCERLRSDFDRVSGKAGPDRRETWKAWRGACDLLASVRGF